MVKIDHSYRHIQRSPLCVLLYGITLLFLTIGWLLRAEPAMPWTFTSAAAFLFIVAGSFHYLAVSDEGTHLSVRFGPFPLFRRKVRFADIRRVETARTTLLDGWGIHYGFRRGWIWNIWGRDCVVLFLQQGILRVGSDDAERLANHVRSKLSEFTEDG